MDMHDAWSALSVDRRRRENEAAHYYGTLQIVLSTSQAPCPQQQS